MEITTITTNNYNLQFRISQKKGHSTSNRIQTEEHETKTNVECEDTNLSFEEDVFDCEIVGMWTVAVIIVLELIFMHNHKIFITGVSGA